MDASLLDIDFEPLTEVKAKLSEKVGRVHKEGRLLAITLNGKPKVVLVPYSEFLSWIQSGTGGYKLRQLSVKEWEKESKQRREVVASVKNMFDLSKLERKGQKPYRQNALKKFK